MAKQMVWLSGHLPYAQAAEVFGRIAYRHIPAASIWRQTQKHGERLEQAAAHEARHVAVERVAVPLHRQYELPRKGISLDGGMVHIREEGWKEFKVGTIFETQPRPVRDPQTHEWVTVPQGVNVTYCAVLGSVTEFSPAFWRQAVQQRLPWTDDTSVTADGAEWIWSLTDDLFPDSLQILDWYHACEHLAKAAAALHPNDPDQANRWYARAQSRLHQGEASLIAHQLSASNLPDHARYFYTHQRRMRYHEFRENGYPIGSGTVESGIKQLKARLTGAGMRWSRSAASQMLLLRAAVLDHSFDARWSTSQLN